MSEQVLFQGNLVPSREVLPEFQAGMMEFPLKDGAMLRVAINVFSVRRLEGVSKEDGTPIYSYRVQTLIDVEPLTPLQQESHCDA